MLGAAGVISFKWAVVYPLVFAPLKVEYLILWTDCLFNRCWEWRIPEVWASVDLRLDLKSPNEELFG